MVAVTIEDAQARLGELIDNLLQSGEDLVITRDGQAVAKLVPEQMPSPQPRRPGSAKGLLTILSDDDEHLADFHEYMP